MKAPLSEWFTATPPSPKWLVPGLIVEGSMMILAGDPGVGKSVLSYSMALSLAGGLPFLGRQVAQRKVLYFDEENSEQDLRSYLHTIWSGMGSPPLLSFVENLHIEHFGLSSHANPFEVLKYHVNSFEPSLVVLDTATPICGIQDENDNAEASAAIKKLRAVRATGPEGCAFLILKHAKVDGETGKRDIRGAKAWKGELDGVLFHTLARGRPPKTGWRPTRLEAGKVRAHGLREPLRIIPVPTTNGWLLTAEADKGEENA